MQIECDLSPLPLPPLTLTLIFIGDNITADGRSGHCIELLPGSIDNPTASVRGSVAALLALAKAPAGEDIAPNLGIVIDGDRALVDDLRQQLGKLDIDGEAALAELIGDVPAHLLGQCLRRARYWQRDAGAHAADGLANFLDEEAPVTDVARGVANGFRALRTRLAGIVAESR
jgi:ubiquinone biosynthesis protein UbiJ